MQPSIGFCFYSKGEKLKKNLGAGWGVTRNEVVHIRRAEMLGVVGTLREGGGGVQSNT